LNRAAKISPAELPRYAAGSGPLALADDAVELWLAFDAHFESRDVQTDLVSQLTPHDSERMRRLHLETRQRQFAITRALQRHALSAYSDVSPSQWKFRASTEGRPALAPDFERTGLHFNLAHADGIVAMAVCRHARVGVDVETLGRAPLAVAERYFSPLEAAQLRALPPDAQPRRFLRLWTLKEACLKAMGTGLAGGLGRMSFLFDSADDFRFERADDPDAARWQFQQFEIGAAHVLALAVLPQVNGEQLRVTWREFRAGSSSGQEQRAEP